MPSSLTIIRQRRERRDALRRSADGRLRQAFFGFGFLATTLAVVLILAAALTYANLTSDLPSVREVPVLLDPQAGLLLQPTRLYDRSGEHLLAVLAPDEAARTYVPYPEIPPGLVNAVIALSEPHFWTSPGYEVEGWRDSSLHPTIGQRLASDLLLWDEAPSVRRALRERLLAGQLVAVYGRQQVLEWYLNSADFGHYAYGVEAAAQLYFGKPASRLDLSECAMLAAVAQAPALNPIDAPQAAEDRRQETLRTMLALGWITPVEAANEANHLPVVVASPEPDDPAPAFVALALSQMDAAFGAGRVERGGLDVITTLDYDLQIQAACTVRIELGRLAGEPEAMGSGVDCTGARRLPPLPSGLLLPEASASALVLDPRTGQVLAMVGDVRDGNEAAYLSTHPAGTSLTPFVYLTAFTRGSSPASLAWDIPGKAENFDGLYRGPLRLRLALANDYLPPAGRLLDQLGFDSVRRLSDPFGLVVPPGADLLAGDFSVSAFELGTAYSIFASEGTLAGQALTGEELRPAAVLSVTGVDHSTWADWTVPGSQAVVSPQLAYLMTHVLSDETARWPSLGRGNPLEVGFPAGVKQGAFADDLSAWTVGYTPGRTVVVWFESGAEAGGEGRLLSGSLWNALTRLAQEGQPVETWAVPEGVTRREVCDPSGMLPTDACPNAVPEVFLPGNEPVQYDTLFRTYQINRETGLLATVFTPPELVEARVYMMVPAEAQAWAETEGLPVPPTAYDAILGLQQLPGAHFTSPSLFADVHAVVELRGSAAGEGFTSYRLEYGQGLNPQAWVQIGSDFTTPVEEGLLAEWDTSGLNGLYALRLLVVYEDQRVERAVLQVAVDNTPPQAAILYPQPGQVVEYADEPQVACLAEVNDPYLEKVEFYVDDRLVATVTTAPFTHAWPARAGDHTLRVVAYDRVGNTTEAEVEFTVNR